MIADDERPARSFLAAMLRAFEDVEIVGEAGNGSEAVELIEREKPDLALLDLQMPELDGLGVVRLLRKDATPLIAFVTAYDEYAIRAFEVNAVDYLLKPVSTERLGQTLERLRAHVRARETARPDDYRAKVTSLLDGALPDRVHGVGRLIVREVGQIIVVPTRD